MQTVLNNVQDDRVVAYIVWLPVLRNDSEYWATERSKEFSDPRVTYYWDPQRYTGNMWRKALKMTRELAWDTYYLYDSDATWSYKPSQPAVHMHQLGGESTGERLDREKFEEGLRELLK